MLLSMLHIILHFSMIYDILLCGYFLFLSVGGFETQSWVGFEFGTEFIALNCKFKKCNVSNACDAGNRECHE